VRPDDFLLAYFGHVYQGKGLETLLKALQIVASRRTHVRLAVIGGTVDLPSRPSYGQEMRALAKHLGVDHKIIWTGEYAWDSDDASVYLRAADVGILPFDRGVRLNNSSFAAMAAHGLPIITTQGACVESPFVHGKNLFLCPPKDPEGMSLAIETLIDTPNLRQHLRLGALALAHEWFSWESATKRTIATFSECGRNCI
jgi:glycosyltransferase involved in cell wall biosynthesis